MMFSLRDFILNGLLSAIGRMDDYKIMLNAAGWQDKGVLELEDLAMIEVKLAEYNEAIKAEQEAIKAEQEAATE